MRSIYQYGDRVKGDYRGSLYTGRVMLVANFAYYTHVTVVVDKPTHAFGEMVSVIDLHINPADGRTLIHDGRIALDVRATEAV